MVKIKASFVKNRIESKEVHDELQRQINEFKNPFVTVKTPSKKFDILSSKRVQEFLAKIKEEVSIDSFFKKFLPQPNVVGSQNLTCINESKVKKLLKKQTSIRKLVLQLKILIDIEKCERKNMDCQFKNLNNMLLDIELYTEKKITSLSLDIDRSNNKLKTHSRALEISNEWIRNLSKKMKKVVKMNNWDLQSFDDAYSKFSKDSSSLLNQNINRSNRDQRNQDDILSFQISDSNTQSIND